MKVFWLFVWETTKQDLRHTNHENSKERELIWKSTWMYYFLMLILSTQLYCALWIWSYIINKYQSVKCRMNIQLQMLLMITINHIFTRAFTFYWLLLKYFSVNVNIPSYQVSNLMNLYPKHCVLFCKAP